MALADTAFVQHAQTRVLIVLSAYDASTAQAMEQVERGSRRFLRGAPEMKFGW